MTMAARRNLLRLSPSNLRHASPSRLHVQTLLSEDGDISEAPLLHPVNEEMLEEAEVREGAPIERTERVPCTIALSKVGDTPSRIMKVSKTPDVRRVREGASTEEAKHMLCSVVLSKVDATGVGRRTNGQSENKHERTATENQHIPSALLPETPAPAAVTKTGAVAAVDPPLDEAERPSASHAQQRTASAAVALHVGTFARCRSSVCTLPKP